MNCLIMVIIAFHIKSHYIVCILPATFSTLLRTGRDDDRCGGSDIACSGKKLMRCS